MKCNDPKIIEWMKTAKGKDICPFLICGSCGKPVLRTKAYLHRRIWDMENGRIKGNICCPTDCGRSFSPNANSYEFLSCKNCGKEIKKCKYVLNKFKNSFCSSSCAATYNNTHKTHGTRRSKLEIWLEEQLPILYPNLEFQFNQKDAINSELDIYIPDLKLAFELNGLFHYEPIFGPEQLTKIQNNDQRKFQACLERGIELCLIDTSTQKQFTQKSAQKFLDVILKVINGRVGQP